MKEFEKTNLVRLMEDMLTDTKSFGVANRLTGEESLKLMELVLLKQLVYELSSLDISVGSL